MTTIKKKLTLLISQIKRKLKKEISEDGFLGSSLKEKLSYRDSADIDNRTKLKPVDYNSEIFREFVDSKEQSIIKKFLNYFRKRVQYDNFESMMAINRRGRRIGGIVRGDEKGVKATKKILKKGEEGNVLATAHNHVRSSSPLASTSDVLYHVKNNLGKYTFSTTNGNGIGIIRDNNQKWTETGIVKLSKDLKIYGEKMKDTFEEKEKQYLKIIWDDLKYRRIKLEKYAELYDEHFAIFKLKNTTEYAKKLDNILLNNNIRFTIFK